MQIIHLRTKDQGSDSFRKTGPEGSSTSEAKRAPWAPGGCERYCNKNRKLFLVRLATVSAVPERPAKAGGDGAPAARGPQWEAAVRVADRARGQTVGLRTTAGPPTWTWNILASPLESMNQQRHAARL